MSLPLALPAIRTATIAPLREAENSRVAQLGTRDKTVQSTLGQYFTPPAVASLMAGMFGPLPKSVHLLDAGAGAGALTAAFVMNACDRSARPHRIHATLFELDRAQLPALERTMVACTEFAGARGVGFSSSVVTEDFLLAATSPLFLEELLRAGVNCAILNPPYAKLRSDSPARAALRTVGLETSNLYSAFVGVATDLMEPGGQLVAITPRSFCNGSYFLPFRRWMLERSSLDEAHIFESRDTAFAEEGVLQENVITKFTRSVKQARRVRITASEGGSDAPSLTRDVSFSDVVHPDDHDLFFRFALQSTAQDSAERRDRISAKLTDLGVQVSTGRVVEFRSLDLLRKTAEAGCVPLLYPHHLVGGAVVWPREHPKKPSALLKTPESDSLLVPRGFYVLVKRLTAKEERRRLVASVLDPSKLRARFVAIENHLNFIHDEGHGLDRDLAYGLSAYLNSSDADQAFRQFSGHTQVNATDLRNMRFPDGRRLRRLGGRLGQPNLTQEEIDAAVAPFLESAAVRKR